jgi:hypothetical protein
MCTKGQQTQGFSQDFETISHFCGTDIFFKIMNKQEYNELNLMVSLIKVMTFRENHFQNT